MKLYLSFCLPLILFLQHCGLGATSLSCIGDNGNPVDWFIAYKLPRTVAVPVQPGYRYLYLDGNSNGFKVSRYSVEDTRSAMGATLQQVYMGARSQRDSLAYVFYNDANPDGKHFQRHGHSKGNVAFNSNNGFWLIHSVPKYPNYIRNSYGYPRSGTIYGQMFLCVSFHASQFDSIGMQLRFIDPHIHDSNLPRGMASQFPNVNALLEDNVITGIPYKQMAYLVSSSGESFIHFTKNRNFGLDLYHDFVAQTLQSKLLTETWQHGSRKIGPSCGGYTVEDITTVKVVTADSVYGFRNSKDHSKFAVAKAGTQYVCVGDINRIETQFSRGGGTLCINNMYIWSNFRQLVEDFNSCNGLADVYFHHRREM